MSAVRTIGVGVLVILLTASLVGANVSRLIGDVSGVLPTQSLALFVLGVVAVGAGLALHYELVSFGAEPE